ncbi:UvrD-helicase domain-containing protein [Vibrio nigripulchritudo]|uniref:UvrD-helicase domain-containing protein n=1 Tax=Vibrio nigripulchritudo TaxID=28173 RepID=UPI002491DEB8|nr:UvrD-helicase domain-containing protein [Vibrio nigripulchritudo]BDU40423.1 DNA helicase [Vibrio nigripulchritudo]BDU46159.1 DNA helicase [Vibrio nigripulchritudo]
MADRIETEADIKVANCLSKNISFSMVAGAGAGKTSSLIEALQLIKSKFGATLKKRGQKVACITYTKRAVQVISSRLGDNDLFVVSTLHSFLWGEIRNFTDDIRRALIELKIPNLIEKESSKDNGGQSQKAVNARKKIESLTNVLEILPDVSSFNYDDAALSDYSKGKLSHDDIIEVAGYLLATNSIFQKAFGYRYPYCFIDEAQDTFPIVIQSFQKVAEGKGLPLVGFFGDPWQQIYDKRAGDFSPPKGGEEIDKTENFRCSTSVISFLNQFRSDLEQYPAGDNKEKEGSVKITLIEAESPSEPRNRYSVAQVERSLKRMDLALELWGWNERTDIIRLFLVRQMIAKRLGFSRLHNLFTGNYASNTAKDGYESGEHYLLKPIIRFIWPLLESSRSDNVRGLVDSLTSMSPAFKTNGKNKNRTLKEMVDLAKESVRELDEKWRDSNIKDVLVHCRKSELIELSDLIIQHLDREPRTEVYNQEEFGQEKGDWLCDKFFEMSTSELEKYCDFIRDNTSYSTQHGVKGEEYPDVLVVMDDIEAAWNNYNFCKLLAPNTFGEPTDGQKSRGEKLAYVSFSRAEDNLRILLYTSKPTETKEELISNKLFVEEQISIIPLD